MFDFAEVVMHQVWHLTHARVENDIGEGDPGLLLVERMELTDYVLVRVAVEEVQTQLLTDGKVLIHLGLLRSGTAGNSYGTDG